MKKWLNEDNWVTLGLAIATVALAAHLFVCLLRLVLNYHDPIP
jgi:hypothetical protein